MALPNSSIQRLMTPAPATTINLASLGAGMPGLTCACGISLVEAATVCLEYNKHESGVWLRVRGTHSHRCRLLWSPVDEQRQRTYNDLQEEIKLLHRQAMEETD